MNESIVGIDLETDLAVIKVDERNLAVLPFGDSDALRAGQLVLACGSPVGFTKSITPRRRIMNGTSGPITPLKLPAAPGNHR